MLNIRPSQGSIPPTTPITVRTSALNASCTEQKAGWRLRPPLLLDTHHTQHTRSVSSWHSLQLNLLNLLNLYLLPVALRAPQKTKQATANTFHPKTELQQQNSRS